MEGVGVVTEERQRKYKWLENHSTGEDGPKE